MKKLVVLIIIMPFCGCVCIDGMAKFTIQGNILDEKLAEPIKDVKVTFVDISMSDPYDKERPTMVLGVSNQNGLFKKDFMWQWGRTKFLIFPLVKYRFSIQFDKEGYKTRMFEYDIESLIHTSDGYFIDLHSILLTSQE